MGRIKAAARRAVKSRKAIIGNAEEFTNFCKEKFEKNAFKPEGEQHFMQEFFYVTNIDRCKKIEAVTTAHTRSFFSICSTGNFCVIEAREVSCVCESCMFGDGQECPNQAYVSSWKAFNLCTGKPILAEAFHNTHWITPESNAPESNAPDSNGHAEENCCRSNRNSKRRRSRQNTMQHEDYVHSSREKSSKRKRKVCQQNINNIDWTRIYAEM